MGVRQGRFDLRHLIGDVDLSKIHLPNLTVFSSKATILGYINQETGMQVPKVKTVKGMAP